MVLNANGDPGRLGDLDLPIVADSQTGFAGPLAGILAGLDYAAEQGHSAILTVAADTPFFPRDLASQLDKAQGEVGLSLAATREAGKIWPQPTFGLWPTALREDLRQALNGGLRKVLHWTDRHDAGFAIWEADLFDPFFNINTPDDLSEAEARVEDTGV